MATLTPTTQTTFAISGVASHVGAVDNPHSVTAEQVGAAATAHTHVAVDTTDFQATVSTNTDVAANVVHATTVTGNPHAVTKADVGLGNADNTSDVNKPVSSAQQAALNLKADIAAGGLVTLDANGEVVEPQAGAAAEVAAGRTNSMKRADGTWSALARHLPDNYALQTWSDDLALGVYSILLSVPQNGLPVGWWHIEVLRHSSDSVGNQYRYLRATPLTSTLAAQPVHHCSVTHAGWSAWTPMERPQSTTAQAITGTDTTTDMSPARVKEAITASNKVLQVVGKTITTQGSQTLWANIDVQVGAGGDFILDVIPVATGSSFLIEYRWFGEVSVAWNVVFNVHRDGVRVNNIGLIKAGLSMATQTFDSLTTANNSSTPEIMHLRTLDKSGSTAGTSIQFKLVAAAMNTARTMWTNRCFNASTANGFEHGVSEVIVTEIAA